MTAELLFFEAPRVIHSNDHLRHRWRTMLTSTNEAIDHVLLKKKCSDGTVPAELQQKLRSKDLCCAFVLLFLVPFKELEKPLENPIGFLSLWIWARDSPFDFCFQCVSEDLSFLDAHVMAEYGAKASCVFQKASVSTTKAS